MANLELSKAKKVMRASDAQTANEQIAKGWTLIDTVSGKDESGYPLTMFVLAWLGEGDPAH